MNAAPLGNRTFRDRFWKNGIAVSGMPGARNVTSTETAWSIAGDLRGDRGRSGTADGRAGGVQRVAENRQLRSRPEPRTGCRRDEVLVTLRLLAAGLPRRIRVVGVLVGRAADCQRGGEHAAAATELVDAVSIPDLPPQFAVLWLRPGSRRPISIGRIRPRR